VNVKEGDAVTQGQTLCILEAMKMDNEIGAPQAGKITKVHVTEGKSVLEGETLISIGA
jgi:acetyl-CoA carboxylase biotin carboxyl carrier protein